LPTLALPWGTVLTGLAQKDFRFLYFDLRRRPVKIEGFDGLLGVVRRKSVVYQPMTVKVTDTF